MLSSDIQYSCLEVLQDLPVVPQTDPGQLNFIHAVNGAALRAVARGFIAPGIWDGNNVPNPLPLTGTSVTAGQSLTSGFLTFSPSVNTLSNAQKSARQAPPIFLCIIEANASQSVVCNVNVQR
jgi:hypothetical protein